MRTLVVFVFLSTVLTTDDPFLCYSTLTEWFVCLVSLSSMANENDLYNEENAASHQPDPNEVIYNIPRRLSVEQLLEVINALCLYHLILLNS